MKFSLLSVAILLVSANCAADPLTVYFSPSASDITVGATFTIDLVADISEPVVGWGLDVTFNPMILTLNSIETGMAWFPAPSFDGDNLAGFAFPLAVAGHSTLLATLNFTALAQGRSDLAALYTPDDLAEGFPLDTGGFADVQFINGSVLVSVPEPSLSLPLGCCLLALLGLSRKKRVKSNDHQPRR